MFRYIAALEERCAHLESALRTSDPSNEDVRDHLGASQPEDDHHSTIQDDHHSTIQDVEDTLDWDQGLADDPWPGTISQIDGLPHLGENVSPFGNTEQLQVLPSTGNIASPFGNAEQQQRRPNVAEDVPSFGSTERRLPLQALGDRVPHFANMEQPQRSSPLYPSFSEISGPNSIAPADQVVLIAEVEGLQSDPVTAAQHVHGLSMKACNEDPTATRKSGLSFARLAKA
jgi:hypothetical protein